IGGDDIYRASFNKEAAAFGVVENLGADVNSKVNEWAPAISSNGKQLLFASNGHGGKGGYDLFVAKRAGKHWRKTKALEGEVNTDKDEFDAAWIDVGKALVFSRSNDIVSERPINLMLACQSEKSYVAPQILGAAINVTDSWNFGPAADLSTPHALLFTSHHPDAARGGLDLYRITYRLTSQK
ncbi:MAG: TolB-like protein, partial [Arenimonas sp.]